MSETTAVDMRVAIAKDVIAQVNARRYTATPGTFLRVEFVEPFPEGAADLRDVVGLPMVVCDVCAKGAMLLSKARLFDAVPLDDMVVEETILGGGDEEILYEAFGEENADLIESAFELYSGDHLACEFGHRHKNPADRLIAIMANIVEHDGIFTP